MTTSEKSWIGDLYASLTTCLGKIWIPRSFKRHASLMEMEQRHLEETEDLFDISLDTGTQPPSRWSISNFISKCRSTSHDNTCDTELPV